MHKPPLLLMESDDNSGHLADLGAALANANPPINIRSIGGGDVNGTGIFTITVDDDSPEVLERLRDIANGVTGVTYVDVEGLTFELKNEPGSLGTAAGKLRDAGVNILSLQVIGNHGDAAIVLVGVADESAADLAREALQGDYFVYPEEHDHLA
jgi:hypothetical protein